MAQTGAGLVKLCGMNQPCDVAAANSIRPDFIGIVVDFAKSPRSVSREVATRLAQSSVVQVVAVIVDPTLAQLDELVSTVRPAAIQLSGGTETPEFVATAVNQHPGIEFWKVLHMTPSPRQSELHNIVVAGTLFVAAGVAKLMIDSKHGGMPGGTGTRVSWPDARDLIESLDVPVLIQGGLNAQNAAEAIATARPAGVDVSSGTETAPGVKSPELMRKFVETARSGFEAIRHAP